MDTELLVIVVHNGLNQKQHDFIEQYNKSNVELRYEVFPEGDQEAELKVQQEVLALCEEYQKEKNKSPYIVFAVSVGQFVIPEVAKQLDKEHIIHVDAKGNRFAF